MKKIPLESTIAGSYKFLFTNIVSIIGTMWFPLALMIALIGGLLYLVVPHSLCQGILNPHEIKDQVLSHLPLLVSGAFLLMILSFLVRAMIAVGVLRHAVGEKKSTTFIYFSLGARVWKMVGVALFAVLIVIALELVITLVIGAVNAAMLLIHNVPAIVVGLVNFVVVAAAVIFALYTVLRLFFFLPAVVVAENKFGVSRAWALGKGNVWRIIALLIVAVVPVEFLAGIAVYLTVIPTVLVEAVRQQPHGPAEAIAFLKSLWPILPVIGGIVLIAAIAMTGLVLGAVGKAYQAVTAPDEAPAEA